MAHTAFIHVTTISTTKETSSIEVAANLQSPFIAKYQRKLFHTRAVDFTMQTRR